MASDDSGLTYGHQSELPSLPVPTLDETMDKLEQTARPFLNETVSLRVAFRRTRWRSRLPITSRGVFLGCFSACGGMFSAVKGVFGTGEWRGDGAGEKKRRQGRGMELLHVTVAGVWFLLFGCVSRSWNTSTQW